MKETKDEHNTDINASTTATDTLKALQEFYPKIDRTTAQDLLPKLMSRKLFSNYNDMPWKIDILDEAKKKLGKDNLTYLEERTALTEAREYKNNQFVIRDYGNYAIGFSVRAYIDGIEKEEERLKRQLTFPNKDNDMPEENIRKILEEITVYKTSFSLSYFVLCEVSKQRCLKGLTIPKEDFVKALGYTTEDKQAYQNIKEGLTTLRWLNYIVWGFSYTSKSKTPRNYKSKMVGNFIYNLKEDYKNYIMDINPNFVGCVEALLEGNRDDRNKKERTILFARGYDSFPISLIALMRDYSPAATMLATFLQREMGNASLKEEGFKVITKTIRDYIKKAGIHRSRPNREYLDFISALKEIEIIEKLSPTITELENIKPNKALNIVLKIWVRVPVEKLNETIRQKLEQRGKNVTP